MRAMVGTAAAGTGATIAVVNGLGALLAWPLYVAAWATAPLPMLFAQAVLALVAFAAWITPEQRRDTRASRHPFRSGLSVVQIGVTEDGQPYGMDLAPRARPPVGLLVVHVAVRRAPAAELADQQGGMVVPGEVVRDSEDVEGS